MSKHECYGCVNVVDDEDVVFGVVEEVRRNTVPICKTCYSEAKKNLESQDSEKKPAKKVAKKKKESEKEAADEWED